MRRGFICFFYVFSIFHIFCLENLAAQNITYVGSETGVEILWTAPPTMTATSFWASFTKGSKPKKCTDGVHTKKYYLEKRIHANTEYTASVCPVDHGKILAPQTLTFTSPAVETPTNLSVATLTQKSVKVSWNFPEDRSVNRFRAAISKPNGEIPKCSSGNLQAGYDLTKSFSINAGNIYSVAVCSVNSRGDLSAPITLTVNTNPMSSPSPTSMPSSTPMSTPTSSPTPPSTPKPIPKTTPTPTPNPKPLQLILSIKSPSSHEVYSQTQLTISGSCNESGALIDLSLTQDQYTLPLSQTVCEGKTWSTVSVTISSLTNIANGLVAILATISDGFGNLQGTASLTFDLTSSSIPSPTTIPCPPAPTDSYHVGAGCLTMQPGQSLLLDNDGTWGANIPGFTQLPSFQLTSGPYVMSNNAQTDNGVLMAGLSFVRLSSALESIPVDSQGNIFYELLTPDTSDSPNTIQSGFNITIAETGKPVNIVATTTTDVLNSAQMTELTSCTIPATTCYDAYGFAYYPCTAGTQNITGIYSNVQTTFHVQYFGTNAGSQNLPQNLIGQFDGYPSPPFLQLSQEMSETECTVSNGFTQNCQDDQVCGSGESCDLDFGICD